MNPSSVIGLPGRPDRRAHDDLDVPHGGQPAQDRSAGPDVGPRLGRRFVVRPAVRRLRRAVVDVQGAVERVGSRPGTRRSRAGSKATCRRSITLWWVLYGLVPLLGIFSAAGVAGQLRSGMTMQTLAQRFRDYAAANIALAVVGMVTTYVYIRLVQQLSGRHMLATREA